jgi:hypothetical protein
VLEGAVVSVQLKIQINFEFRAAFLHLLTVANYSSAFAFFGEKNLFKKMQMLNYNKQIKQNVKFLRVLRK